MPSNITSNRGILIYTPCYCYWCGCYWMLLNCYSRVRAYVGAVTGSNTFSSNSYWKVLLDCYWGMLLRTKELRMSQNSSFEQCYQLLSKHLALLPPPSAPAFLYCFEQFAKKVAQNNRGAFMENKVKTRQTLASSKRVRFLRGIVEQPTNGIMEHFGICSIILKLRWLTIIAKDKATKVSHNGLLLMISRVVLAIIDRYDSLNVGVTFAQQLALSVAQILPLHQLWRSAKIRQNISYGVLTKLHRIPKLLCYVIYMARQLRDAMYPYTTLSFNSGVDFVLPLALRLVQNSCPGYTWDYRPQGHNDDNSKAKVGGNYESPHDWNCESCQDLTHNYEAKVTHNSVRVLGELGELVTNGYKLAGCTGQ